MDVEQLISSIFVKNPLWDQKDPQHHNRYRLDKLWDDVAGEMKSTRAIVRSKWKTLRDTFRKELKKVTVIKYSGDGYVTPIKSTWQYFDSLNFLRDQFTVRSSAGNLPGEGYSPIIADEDENTQDPNIIDDINTQNLQKNDELNLEERISTQESRTRTTITPSTSRSGPEKKRKRENEVDELGNTLIKLEESKLRLIGNQTKTKPDEDMSFFESLLPHIKPLSPQRKLLLRMKLQETVYNFIYDNQPAATQNNDSISRQTGYQQPQYSIIEIGQPLTVQENSNQSSVRSYLSGFSDDI